MSELKNNFILVHDNNDNSPIVINEKYIIKIYTNDNNENVVYINNNICNDDAIESISINERPEKVLNQLTKSNYIKVHDIEDNSIIILSIKDIIAVYKDYYNNKIITNIELCDSTNFFVYESVETIIKLCKGENFNL
jgi:hypothetical protein